MQLNSLTGDFNKVRHGEKTRVLLYLETSFQIGTILASGTKIKTMFNHTKDCKNTYFPQLG